MSPSYETTTNNYLDTIPTTTTTDYDFNQFEIPKYETMNIPIIIPLKL